MFFTFILIYSQLFYHGLQGKQVLWQRQMLGGGKYCFKRSESFLSSRLSLDDTDLSASQPFGYIGCLPDSSFNDQHTSHIGLNDGVYCVGFCKTSGFRYAATKGQTCKCASNLTTSDLKGNDSCDYICPGRKSERCGGESSVSLYDTLPYSNCVEHPYGSTSLIGEKFSHEFQRYENNSATMCASYCTTLEYKFSATQAKLCICGDRVNDALKSSNCETKCPGNGEEICGGVYSVSLRDTGLQESIQYKTFVEDSHGVLALEHDGTKRYADHNNSATQCATKCNKLGYPLSGTKINLCICGDRLRFNITESSKCEMKCPGNKTETCGGDGSVSIRFIGYVPPYTTMKDMTTSSTKMTPGTTTQKTTTQITETPNIEGTTVTPRPTRTATPLPDGVVSTIYSAPETSSQKGGISYDDLSRHDHHFRNDNQTDNDTKGSPSTGSQMIAVYITLPGLIIVASSVAIIVWLILRHKRLLSEARDKRDEVASCYFTQALDRNITSDDKHIYNTICPDASQYGEDATQRNTAGKTNATDYLTPKNSNGTPDYLTLIDSNDTGEYTIPEDPKDSNEYLTPGDPKDSNEYLTPKVPKDSSEYLTPGDPNYTTKYRTPADPNYSDGYVIPVDSNDTTEYSVESKQYYDDVY